MDIQHYYWIVKAKLDRINHETADLRQLLILLEGMIKLKKQTETQIAIGE